MDSNRQMTASAVELLKRMVGIPSLSFQEEERSAFLFAELSRRADDLKAKGYGNIIVEKFYNNIVLYKENFCSCKPVLMLNSHIDTVPAASAYTFDPFSPFEKDGAIYGLGTNDDGASVVSQIETFFHLVKEELSVNLLLVLTAEEERSGSTGMAKFVGEYPVQPDFAIIGEPTGMEAAVAERGLLVLDGTATGISGHAARNEGVNALYIALDDINTLRNYRFEHTSPLMGDVKLSVTQLNCGTAHNVVPAEATFVVDIRPTEQYSNQQIVELLQKEVKSSLKARNLKNRSSATPEDHPLMHTVNSLGITKQISATTSDWMKIPYPAIKMGPGDSSRSHKADEFIKIAEIEGAIQGYINFIKHIK